MRKKVTIKRYGKTGWQMRLIAHWTSPEGEFYRTDENGRGLYCERMTPGIMWPIEEYETYVWPTDLKDAKKKFASICH